MQTTSDLRMRTAFGRVAAARVLVFAALLAISLLALVLTPGEASAKSYSMPKVDISSQVETDGSLHFTEQRTFTFDGSYSALWWTFENLPSGSELKVNSVRMASADEDGNATGEFTTLDSVPFVLSWRDSGGPGTDSYSVDSPKNTAYVFFDATDESVIIELDYTVTNGAQAYKDVGEVYWKYIGSQWAEPSENVTMTFSLPVPQGTEVNAGDNVRAWGHGPLDGSVKVNADGTIVYTVPHVNAGQYAEARIVFPVSWLTNLSAEAAALHKDETRLDTVLKEEQTWADQANRERMASLAFIIGCGVVCVAAIAWALWSYFRFGKEHEPDFKEEYWRDVPQAGVHPAVIGRLWRWDRESQDDFTATLMHLSHIGALRIDKGSYEESKLFGSKTVDDYYLTLVPAVADTVSDPIDRGALDLLFEKVAAGNDSLWFGTIQKYGEDNPEDFVEAMKTWQGTVSAQTNRYDYFEAKGKRYQGYLIALAVVAVAVGIGSWLLLQNFIPLIFTVPTAIALAVIANYMPRRSVEGNNLVAKCKALRNWLRDFSSLDERPPTDVKVWGEFMVYAYLFGIAEQVMKSLQTRVPEVFQDESAVYGVGYVPWWFWYSSSYGAHGGMMSSGASLFDASVANTMSTAQAAISGASGDFSSGGGFGGGFSGGGGGGFGGGGGGAR